MLNQNASDLFLTPNAGIRWGGVLQVQFKTPVEPEVFAKVFHGCKTEFSGCKREAAACNQEPGELAEQIDTTTVKLDRDDMLRIFGKVRKSA